jgi:hypothetical protein
MEMNDLTKIDGVLFDAITVPGAVRVIFPVPFWGGEVIITGSSFEDGLENGLRIWKLVNLCMGPPKKIPKYDQLN